jgi:hypothetical protein
MTGITGRMKVHSIPFHASLHVCSHGIGRFKNPVKREVGVLRSDFFSTVVKGFITLLIAGR